jgi:undecaprenyl-diphosphatase
MDIVVNAASGTVSTPVIDRLEQAGLEAEIRIARNSSQLTEELERASSNESFGVAGGDGSVSSAAQLATQRRRQLAVIPMGTLNHFAKDIGIPTVDDAISALRSGRTRSVDVGELQTEAGTNVFLNNVCFGLYPQFVQERVRHEHHWTKWIAAAIALLHVVRDAQPVEVSIDGSRELVWLLFVGNGRYGEEGLSPTSRADLSDGLLDVRIVRARHKYRVKHLMRAIWRSSRKERYIQFDATNIEVLPGTGSTLVARDGEVDEVDGPVTIVKHRSGLTVFAPHN